MSVFSINFSTISTLFFLSYKWIFSMVWICFTGEITKQGISSDNIRDRNGNRQSQFFYTTQLIKQGHCFNLHGQLNIEPEMI